MRENRQSLGKDGEAEREKRRHRGGGREDKGWMNNAFAKRGKQHAAGREDLQRGKIDLEKGCPLTLRSAPEISVYLSQSLCSLFSLLFRLLQLGRGWDWVVGGLRTGTAGWTAAGGQRWPLVLYLGLWVNVAVCCGTAS